MSTENFPSAAYDLSLIPADDTDDIGTIDAWQDYCAEARHINRQHILDAVLSSLDADNSPLYPMIDSCLKDPQEPGRARESLTVLAALGRAILNITAAAVDDAVGLRMVIGGVR